MNILEKLCINIYHGVLFVLNLVFSFVKYLFLGLKNFPGLFIDMLGSALYGLKVIGSGFKPTTPKEKIDKGDELLAEAKRNAEAKEIREEELRNRLKQSNEKEAQKELDKYMSNSDSLLDEEKPKKESVFKKIFGFLNSDLGSKKIDVSNMEEVRINFDGEDAVKSKEKQTYEYLIQTPEGKVMKGYFNAFSRAEVHSFLVSEGNKVYKIETSKWINLLHGPHGSSGDKFKTKDLIFFIAQLSTYLKAGIALSEAVKILVKQFPSPKYKRILRTIVYDLSTGFSFSEALEKQGNAFPSILINMVKTAEMTGELPETLDDMEEYFSQIEETRKAMVTAMMYPAIIFVITIGVGTFIMLFVVPKFVDIYKTMDGAEIPWITTAVLNFSNFLQKYIIYIGILFIVVLLLFIYLYQNVKTFRRNVQWFLMHLPVFGNVMIYNEVTTFTKTFASLLKNNVFITDSMEILQKITNNEIYKEMIYDAINNVSKGKSVSLAFKDQWAFPIPAYEMIVTGEKTGQLPEMMDKVSVYYQDLHKNSVSRIKTFIEPVLIIILTAMVGVIVLSIVIPMFSMYSQIQA